MAALASPTTLAEIPSELIEIVARTAARDADKVRIFLDTFAKAPGMEWLAQKPVYLPGDFLLGLGAALRLLAWEQCGIAVHREAGLSSAHDALHDVLLALTHPEAKARVAHLPDAVLALTVERFAWSARAELDADVTLGQAEEEQVLEALADFLWANRPRERTGRGHP